MSSSSKPYCKVCHDAGKTEREYTSHFVKSVPGVKGIVVCPTLLAQECKHCFKKGHTINYCKVLMESKKKQTNKKIFHNTNTNTNTNTEKQQAVKKTNMFDILGEEEEENPMKQVSKVSKVKKDDFPSLPNQKTSKKPMPVLSISYAAIAQQSNEAIQIEEVKKIVEKKLVVSPISPPPISQIRRSWAEWSDSEDEEEEKVSSYVNPYDNDEDDETW